jgi:hypothetical protein
MHISLKGAVIASEAKQSRWTSTVPFPRDCFVAALLAMTRCVHRVAQRGRGCIPGNMVMADIQTSTFDRRVPEEPYRNPLSDKMYGGTATLATQQI